MKETTLKIKVTEDYTLSNPIYMKYKTRILDFKK